MRRVQCQCCDKDFEYEGKGRPPSYCPLCRPYVRQEYNKNYHRTYKYNKKKRKKVNQNYYLRHKDKRKPQNSDKQKEARDKWAKTHWKQITLNGWKIYIRCDKYHIWWQAMRKKKMQYHERYGLKYRQEPKTKQNQSDYHKRHRGKYHRGTDMGHKVKRYISGDVDFKNERSVIDNEFKRLGLKKTPNGQEAA